MMTLHFSTFYYVEKKSHMNQLHCYGHEHTHIHIVLEG